MMFPKDSILNEICVEMKKAGYKRISICSGHVAGIDSENRFSFADRNIEYAPKGNIGIPVWDILKKFKVSAGAGNSHQHQCNEKMRHECLKFFESLPNGHFEYYRDLTHNTPWPEQGGLKIDLTTYKPLDEAFSVLYLNK